MSQEYLHRSDIRSIAASADLDALLWLQGDKKKRATTHHEVLSDFGMRFARTVVILANLRVHHGPCPQSFLEARKTNDITGMLVVNATP